MLTKESVAECIRANRAKKRMSRDELSRASGIPASTLENYENEKTNISLTNACKLADVFNMALDDLFERQKSA